MGVDDLRRVAYHLRVRRGTALFMRFWLLVEGETEFWLLPEIARALGIDLRAEGVECLEFAQSGLGPLARLANHLHIGWHMLSDGDRAGQSYGHQATALAHRESSRITVLRERDIENCLWEHGYHRVYMEAAGLPPGAKPRRGRAGEVIGRAIKSSSKPHLAILLGEAMRAPGSPGVPEQLETMIRDAVHWAAHGRFPEPY
jgi:putative ATP-dependent endonuclease of OLD family